VKHAPVLARDHRRHFLQLKVPTVLYRLYYNIVANIKITVGSPGQLAHVRVQVLNPTLIHAPRCAVINSQGLTAIHRLALLLVSDPPS
jgi:hypothetical protein